MRNERIAGVDEATIGEASVGREVTVERDGCLGALSRRSILTAGLLPLTMASVSVPGLYRLGASPSTEAPPPAGTAGAAKLYGLSYVSFDDITPPYLTLTESWNAQGLDDRGRVYTIWTSTRKDGRLDSALFRYTPATRAREFLGTFIDVATAQKNIKAGEQIPKGHTRILQVGRKMYMASQGFHDFKGSIDTLPQYRGAHLFSYDIDTGAFDDVSRKLPGGVVVNHQGIISLEYSPEHHLLVGLTHPLSDIVLFDLRRGEVHKVVTGIPWQLNHMVSREVVVTRNGKIYTYRGPEDPTLRDQKNEVWVYDIVAGTMKRTGQVLHGGFWNGQAQTRDRGTVYLSTVSGELYVLDVDKGTFRDLGLFIDQADYSSAQKYRVAYLYGISLNAAEDTVIGLPILDPTAGGGSSVTRFTRYDIHRRRFAKEFDATTAVFTGSNHRDRNGTVYMSAFDWNTHCKLAVIEPSRPTKPTT